MPKLTDTGIAYNNTDYNQSSAGTYVSSSNTGYINGTTTISLTGIPATANKITVMLQGGTYSGGPQSPLIQFFCNSTLVSNIEQTILRASTGTGTYAQVGYSLSGTNSSVIGSSPYQTLTNLKLEIWKMYDTGTKYYAYRFYQQGCGENTVLYGFGRFTDANTINQINLNSHTSTSYPWSYIIYRLYYE